MQNTRYKFLYKMVTIGFLLGLTLSALAEDFTKSKLLAEQGDVQAQYDMGKMYFIGNNVPQSYAIADD